MSFSQYRETVSMVKKSDYIDSSIVSIHQLFEQKVVCSPCSVAVEFKTDSFTYGQLNNIANQIAKELIFKGVKAGDRIGVLSKRSHHTVASILGVLKSGAAYVPIDGSYHDELIEFICNDGDISGVVTTTDSYSAVPEGLKAFTVVADLMDSMVESDNLDLNLDIDRPVLLIYTSGSTGKPKGALHCEREQLVRINWLLNEYPFKVGEIVGQRSNIGFIPSVWELLGGLLGGVKTVIIPDEIIKDPEALGDLVLECSISRLSFVPYLLKTVLSSRKENIQKFSALKWISIAGAPLPIDLYLELRDVVPRAIILNEYGTTEANGITFFDTSRLVRGQTKTVPIGKAIPGVELYIFDDDMALVSEGGVGRLYVSKRSTCQQYASLEELNKRAFCKNPVDLDGPELFSTGDVVRLVAKDCIEYLGRTDNQLKVKGVRVEPEQLESVLLEHKEVKGAVAIAWQPDGGDVRGLVVFVLAVNRYPGLLNEIKELAQSRLPPMLMPSIWRFVRVLPTTPSGKIDRKPLVETTANNHLEFSGGARNNIKQFLAASLKRALYCADEDLQPGVSLGQLGVDSLTIVELIKLWEKNLDISLTISEVFSLKNLEEVEKYLNHKVDGKKYRRGSVSDLLEGYSFLSLPEYSGLDVISKVPPDFGGVLLTGVTGFLGANLLEELVKVFPKVFCIVRCNNEEEGVKRLQKAILKYGIVMKSDLERRIEIIPGDIGDNHLGVDEKKYRTLLSSVSHVLHAGASVHHLSSYEELKLANVDGTQSILKFCKESKIKSLLFVSSIAVNKIKDEDEQGLNSGYAESKWVAEKLVENASLEGVSTNIVRCGNISNPIYRIAPGRKDVVLCESLKLLASINELPQEQGAVVDIIPVDVAASSLVELLVRDTEERVKLWELSNPNPLSLMTAISYLSESMDKEEVSVDKWLTACRSVIEGARSTTVKSLTAFFSGTHPSILEYYFPTVSHLPKLMNSSIVNGISFPELNEEYIKQFASKPKK